MIKVIIYKEVQDIRYNVRILRTISEVRINFKFYQSFSIINDDFLLRLYTKAKIKTFKNLLF
jgi:hypothetical protein